MIQLVVKNESTRKHLYRTSTLQGIAERIVEEKGDHPGRAPWPKGGTPLELSLLFCDDGFMAELNEKYRNKTGPTDVLSFAQEFEHHGHPEVLGDIVISLETVERFCKGERAAMRAEIKLLFCHGLLHILGHGHGTEVDRVEMNKLQAQYLDIPEAAAWHKP